MKKKELFDLINKLGAKVSQLESRLRTLELEIRHPMETSPPTSESPQQPIFVPTGPTSPFRITPKSSCRKCGLDLSGVMGYVCNDPMCPTMTVVTCKTS